MTRRRIACRTARRGGNGRSPDTAERWSSYAGWPVPDRVPYGPSLDDISSRAVSPVAGLRAVAPVAHSRLVTSPLTSVTSRLCGGHGRAHRTPVVCHAPAQHGLSPTPPPLVYERLFFYAAVAFPQGTLGGAAQAGRWAAPQPEKLLSNRTNQRRLHIIVSIHVYLLSRRKCGIFVPVKRKLQGSMVAFIGIHKIKKLLNDTRTFRQKQACIP